MTLVALAAWQRFTQRAVSNQRPPSCFFSQTASWLEALLTKRSQVVLKHIGFAICEAHLTRLALSFQINVNGAG